MRCFSEVNSSIFYKTAAERERLVFAEREHVMNRVKKIIDLKHKMCDGTDKGFVIINQKVRRCFDNKPSFAHVRCYFIFIENSVLF